ncbi:MAG: hypothetical protein ABL971_06920 [Vicinamibacterales bacterium]
MKTCEYAGVPFTEPRSHPWVDVAGNPDCRYYDLTATPSHIRSSLEDFQHWSGYAAIEDFYRLLEELNQPTSALESNDCAFTGPHKSDQPMGAAALQGAFECSGRVMVLFRELRQNTANARVEGLKDQLHHALAELDPDFPRAMIGTTLIPVRYLMLPVDEQHGWQLMISFWAWGDTVADTMANLKRLVKNLALALRTIALQTLSARAAHP